MTVCHHKVRSYSEADLGGKHYRNYHRERGKCCSIKDLGTINNRAMLVKGNPMRLFFLFHIGNIMYRDTVGVISQKTAAIKQNYK